MSEGRRRRVYRTRRVTWSYTLAAIATLLLVSLHGYGATSRSHDVGLEVTVALGVLCTGWWPRLVVDSDGVRAYSVGRRRVFVPWAQIDGVGVGQGRSFQRAIILTVAGRDLVLPGLQAATGGFGLWRYGDADLQRAFDDVAARLEHRFALESPR